MKTMLKLVVAGLMSVMAVRGQPSGPPRREGNGDGGGGPGGWERPERPQVRPRDGEGGERERPVVEGWLRRVREEDPEEFERLRRMRREDPQGFREAMREAFSEKRGERGGSGPQTGGAEVREALRAVREADGEAERDAAVTALRSLLAARAEERLAMREERIARIRADLERLEAQHAADRARRDAWVEETLDELLSAPAAAE
jgi:hypothetical protein